MNFTGFEFGTESRHHMLMLLDATHADENGAFNENLVMIMGAREVDHFDLGLGVSGDKTFSNLIRCHGLRLSRS